MIATVYRYSGFDIVRWLPHIKITRLLLSYNRVNYSHVITLSHLSLSLYARNFTDYFFQNFSTHYSYFILISLLLSPYCLCFIVSSIDIQRNMDMMHIKTSGSESWGQEKAACIRIFRPMWPLQWVIYTDGRSKFLKCCSSAAITAIA